MRERKTELEYAFPRTVPVMAGYLVLGAAYGILIADIHHLFRDFS